MTCCRTDIGTLAAKRSDTSTLMHSLEWARLPGDLIFILLGVMPLVIAALKTYTNLRRGPALSINAEPEPARAAS